MDVKNGWFDGIDMDVNGGFQTSETRKSIVKTFFDWWEHNVD